MPARPRVREKERDTLCRLRKGRYSSGQTPPPPSLFQRRYLRPVNAT
jgi:hypothetical protein